MTDLHITRDRIIFPFDSRLIIHNTEKTTPEFSDKTSAKHAHKMGSHKQWVSGVNTRFQDN